MISGAGRRRCAAPSCLSVGKTPAKPTQASQAIEGDLVAVSGSCFEPLFILLDAQKVISSSPRMSEKMSGGIGVPKSGSDSPSSMRRQHIG